MIKVGRKTFKHLTAGILLAAGLQLPALVSAETIEVPVGQQAKQKWTMERPVTGMPQAQVEAFFGKPADWRDAVGEPPISSWIYPDFVVYFEYDRVLHTVLRHTESPVASNQDSSQD